MKTETILNNLLKVKDNPFKYMDVLENTINELKIDIYNESMGLKNRKQDPQKKALKFLNDNKKRFSGCRSCMAYAHQTIINGNNVQVFTDSYIAFILKTFYKLPLWDNEKEKNKYPEIERVLPDKKYGEVVNLGFKDIIAKLKAKQIEEKDGVKLIELNSDSYKCFFDADNLKKICDILGTTELVMRLYGELKPALIIDEKTDNQAVITPIRKYC
jgi:hypothetical protein|nr:MAG TPA: DNA polymerase III beta subunit, C-terminal domain [Bacteriophage sp.]